ncbi:MAG: hypothetical protein P9L92_14675 [Candidatus Electryonea clarkiae]|nr:hypothetical protein [Candidatus Electryonea clarkiae]MDP8288321.1 hypothetical protein [Candidatus Electryonea clarkiae]
MNAKIPTLNGLNKLLYAPFRDEMFATIILRGLTPTAIHIIPLQGKSKGNFPCQKL